jgi:hypothetical protein
MKKRPIFNGGVIPSDGQYTSLKTRVTTLDILPESNFVF